MKVSVLVASLLGSEDIWYYSTVSFFRFDDLDNEDELFRAQLYCCFVPELHEKVVNMSVHGCVCACVVARVLVKSRRHLCGTSVKAALFSCITWNDTQRWHTVRTLTHTGHGTHTQIRRRTRQAKRRACQSLPGPRKELISAHMSPVLFKNRECRGELPVFSQVRFIF